MWYKYIEPLFEEFWDEVNESPHLNRPEFILTKRVKVR